MFGAHAVTENGSQDEPFAFFSDGEIIVNGSGTLQVIDLLGRVLLTESITSQTSHRLPLTSPGVYVLRLVNDNANQCQKIVVQ